MAHQTNQTPQVPGEAEAGCLCADCRDAREAHYRALVREMAGRDRLREDRGIEIVASKEPAKNSRLASY